MATAPVPVAVAADVAVPGDCGGTSDGGRGLAAPKPADILCGGGGDVGNNELLCLPLLAPGAVIEVAVFVEPVVLMPVVHVVPVAAAAAAATAEAA